MEKFNPEKWIVDVSDFEKDPKRKTANKEGGCGVVTFWIYKPKDKNNKWYNTKCAKKSIKKLGGDTKTRFDREISILATYQHPAIVPFIGYYITPKNAGFIYLQAMEYGSLRDVIVKNNKDDEKDSRWDDTHKLIIAYGVAAAVEYLHSHNVIHRDLKPLNVLIDENLRPFVTDFDTSKEVNPSLSIHQSITATTQIIMAPEFFENPETAKQTKEIDVYAYGITIYHLITGITPFEGIPALSVAGFVMAGKRPTIPDYTPDYWKDLIERCWDQNPTHRPSFTEIANTLESDKFNNDSIDQTLFQEYIDLIKPFRQNSASSFVESAPIKKLSDPILPSSTPLSKSANDQPIEPTNMIEEKPKSSEQTKDVKKPAPSPAEDKRSPLEKLKDEASKGNFATQLELGKALFAGTFGSPDYKEASKNFIRVANLCKNKELSYEAEYEYAKCLIKLEKYDDARSFLLKRVIYHGNGEASFLLAEMIFNGQVIPSKENEMEGLYEIAAKTGYPDAVIKYSMMSELGTFGHPALENANRFFKFGSDKGIPQMMYKWSIQLEFGRGVEKDVETAMGLLQGAARVGCVDAQFDYAMHLLKGINVDKDSEEAKFFFRSAAQNGHSTAMLFYYVLDVNSETPELDEQSAEELLNNCIDAGLDFDALAVKGQNLHRQGQIKESFDLLREAAQKGSLLALLELGSICEKEPKYGKSDYYYQRASIICHAHDQIGFTTPICINVYHCFDCNADICEGCAKSCHKDHNTTLIQADNCFSCQCGKKGLADVCTSKVFGNENIYQHAYQCATCFPYDDQHFMCKCCIESCHDQHEIIDYGIQKTNCCCGILNPYCRCNGI